MSAPRLCLSPYHRPDCGIDCPLWIAPLPETEHGRLVVAALALRQRLPEEVPTEDLVAAIERIDLRTRPPQLDAVVELTRALHLALRALRDPYLVCPVYPSQRREHEDLLHRLERAAARFGAGDVDTTPEGR